MQKNPHELYGSRSFRPSAHSPRRIHLGGFTSWHIHLPAHSPPGTFNLGYFHQKALSPSVIFFKKYKVNILILRYIVDQWNSYIIIYPDGKKNIFPWSLVSSYVDYPCTQSIVLEAKRTLDIFYSFFISEINLQKMLPKLTTRDKVQITIWSN